MKQNSGFTLIELLVVVLIIGILTAVALPQYTTAVEKSRAAEALTLMSAVSGSAQRYFLQKDVWPTESDWNRLDVEIPIASGTTRGGKSFFIRMGAVDAHTFVVTAARRLDNSSSKYVLKTIVTEQTNGTFTTVRTCGATDDTTTTNTLAAENTDSFKFCYAVTNGKPADF